MKFKMNENIDSIKIEDFSKPIFSTKKAISFRVGVMHSEIRNLIYFGRTYEGRYEFIERLGSEKQGHLKIRSWIMDGFDDKEGVINPKGLYYSKIYRICKDFPKSKYNKEYNERSNVWDAHMEEIA